jgi:hypothetical protein
MARVSPSEYSEKWSRRLKGATEDIRRGISRVTEAPGQAAARAQDLMKAKLNASIDDGTWARTVGAVSVDDWKRAATEKGVNRIAQGVDSAVPGQTTMAAKLLENVDQAVAIVKRLPKGTIEDSINRMGTYAREMNKRKIR